MSEYAATHERRIIKKPQPAWISPLLSLDTSQHSRTAGDRNALRILYQMKVAESKSTAGDRPGKFASRNPGREFSMPNDTRRRWSCPIPLAGAPVGAGMPIQPDRYIRVLYRGTGSTGAKIDGSVLSRDSTGANPNAPKGSSIGRCGFSRRQVDHPVFAGMKGNRSRRWLRCSGCTSPHSIGWLMPLSPASGEVQSLRRFSPLLLAKITRPRRQLRYSTVDV
jgi:hypothetical protein